MVSRRKLMLSTMGGLLTTLAASRGSAGSPSKADKIFLDYDKAGLDAAYDQRQWADNIGEVYARLQARNAAVLAELGEPERHAYGNSPVEGLDWYRAEKSGAPIHIHFHGGAWQLGEARQNAFIAQPSAAAGAHVVIPDFDKVTDRGGKLRPLAQQCREAVAWVHRNAASLDADADNILVSGHSSGAHLAALVLTTDWGAFDLPVHTVKHGLLVSGMYDLYPVSLSSRNQYLSLTENSIAELSPLQHLEHLSAATVIAVGSRESPEFQRQSLQLFSSLRAQDKPSRLITAEGMNHFDIVEDMSKAGGVVGREGATLLGL